MLVTVLLDVTKNVKYDEDRWWMKVSIGILIPGCHVILWKKYSS